MMSAHDRRNGVGDFGITNYLAKFDQVCLSISAREDDVFFRPGMDLPAMRAA
jgi:hypothetical protein